jgi:hypothetical protein
MTFQELCESLEQKIQDSYMGGVTLEDAEKLAGEFLYAQIKVSEELKKASLDARMRKSGIKAVRAGVYLKTVKENDKKPTEAMISALVDTNPVVQEEQDLYDAAEVNQEELERYYNIFQNAHIHFRTVARGRFD